jgi:GDP-L-fucose synthase
MERDARIFVAGGATLIGAAILRALQRQGHGNLVGQPGAEPLLTEAGQVDAFFAGSRPEYVFVAAGKSGGIEANRKYPADLLLDNLLVTCHLLQSACRHRVEKLLYLASSCVYPRDCPQPMRVESLLTGPFEPTNEAYATAKMAGIKLCQAYRQQYGAPFIVGIPANAFGPGDDFRLEQAHVVAALIRKMHAAKINDAAAVEVWGTGTPRREFLFADDLADACLFVMRHYDGGEPINLGSSTVLSIGELAALVKEAVGFRGELRYERNRPDGMPWKALDSQHLASLGWRARTAFADALEATYQSYLRDCAAANETRQTSDLRH